jgi:hypothetical protein
LAVLAVVKCSLCITILPVLCVGAVIFMLRILAALLTERKSLSPGTVRVYFAKFDPVKRPGELIIMNSKNYVHNSAVTTGKRVAFIVAVAVALTLPLHGQQTAAGDSAGAPGSVHQQASTAPQKTQKEVDLAENRNRAGGLSLAWIGNA